MTRTRALAATLIAVCVATLVAVLPASGHDPTGARTLSFTSTEARGDERFVDLGPSGPSIGDRVALSTELRGTAPGRLAADCVWAGKRYAVLQCDIVLILPDGRLTLHGAYAGKRIPHVGGTREEYAITGGTGAYVGASGTMRREGGGERDTLTVTLAG